MRSVRSACYTFARGLWASLRRDDDDDFANPRRYPPADHGGIVVLRLHTPTSKLQVGRLVSFFTTQAEGVAGKLWILDEIRARDWTP